MKIMVGYRPREKGNMGLLELAVKHANAFNGEILLATSMPGGKDVELKEFNRAEEKLDQAKDLIEEQGIKVETKLLVRGLLAGEDLVNFSKEMKADEIIIGIKNRSKLGKLIFGSTAQYIILKAGCPVLSTK
ncbi:MAG: universal stress protein [Desulfobacteraceae bacterium]|nr:universal stress protein [Desulfobacteraceae bacterium]